MATNTTPQSSASAPHAIPTKLQHAAAGAGDIAFANSSNPDEVITVIGETGLYQLIYVSLAVKPMDAAELALLAQSCINFNHANGITGAMMYGNGVFVQWLEGEKSVLRPLWKRILKDKRHHCVVELLSNDALDERMFPQWQFAPEPASRADILAMVAKAHDHPKADPKWRLAVDLLLLLLGSRLLAEG